MMCGIALLSLNRIIKNLIFGLGGTLLFLALVISGWGDWTSFFFNPARTGAIILALTGAIAYGFSGSSGLAIGRAEDRSSRWIFIPIIIIGVAFGWLPPHLDRLNLWTIDGIPSVTSDCSSLRSADSCASPPYSSLAIASACSSRFNPITDSRPTVSTL
jgi:hypothetical protein